MASILDSPLIVVTGKGGTGKTTVAVALGMAAAERGHRVIVCETGRQARVPALYGTVRARPGDEVAVEDGLWTTSIDALGALEEWLGRQLPRRLVGVLARSGAFGAFVNAAPGARELVTMTKAWELGQQRRWRRDAQGYDVVVLDAPASGHGLGLLRTPRTFADIARVGPIASQARRVDEALTDPGHTACVAVSLPGELPVSETLELERRLEERLGRGFDAIVVNGVWPRRLTSDDAERLAAADGALPGAVLHAARAAATRARTQQAQLSRLRRHAVGDVHQLPFVFAERLGLDDLRDLSHRLARSV
jgi:anion-transporting  ArsA/GET3 family ATPase